MTKFCKDCQHYWRSYLGPDRCVRPIERMQSLVRGECVRRLDAWAETERKPGRTLLGYGRYRCGPEARFFVPKEEAGSPPPAGDD